LCVVGEFTTVPDEIWLRPFTVLDLSGSLAEVSPSLAQMTMLTCLKLVGTYTSLPSLALLRNITSLTLGHELTAFPEGLCDMRRLTDLDLSNNKIQSLPSEVSRLVNLSNVNLSFNQIATLPDSMAALVSVQNLDISNNQLACELPMWIEDCDHLTHLDVSENPLLFGSIPATKARVLIHNTSVSKLK